MIGEPRLLVMMTMVFLKSTVLPCPSVSRPSSSTCNSTLKTSECAFSISSNKITEYGLRRTASLNWPPFLIADVAGRRADEPRDGVFLHVFAHVYADHRALVVEKKFRQRARRLRFAHAGRPKKNK